MHFEVVFDIGLDYGAEGGPAWDTSVIGYPNGATRRNINRSNALGQWQLGNRDMDAATWHYMRDFHIAMRGRAHTFLYKDWNDYEANNEPLSAGGGTTQLTKTYGLGINDWVRDILKPKAATVVIEILDGSTWVEVDPEDYELDATTGVITWLDPPDTGDQVRWSGQFFVPARFDRDIIEAQFLSLERRDEGDKRAYAIGPISVVEDPEA